MRVLCVFLLMLTVSCTVLWSQTEDAKRDSVRYEKYYRDPVLREMAERTDSIDAVADSITAEIQSEWKARAKEKREERRVIRFDLDGISKPGSPADFDAPFHFPPVAQYYTDACWSFGTTSFLESEIHRLTGREIKLSELYTVYWEFVEKARGFVRSRGNRNFPAGSESDAVLLIWEKYGIVPAEVYTGLTEGSERHDHRAMTSEMRSYLEYCEESGLWDEENVIGHIRCILDRHIGRPPEEFVYGGKRMTPKRFLTEIGRLDLGDYVQVMSTLAQPFFQYGEFEVPDNWRPTDTYLNLPLDRFYACIGAAVDGGYTVCIGGDVSEPGYNGFEDVAVVPTFDIPQDYIDQDSREFRFYNGTTEDDHGLHLLSRLQLDGHDWFLIKDSARSSRHGKYEGYYFYRGDYVRLKMLTYMVHRDVLERMVPEFEDADRNDGKDEKSR
jgi:bleomycin hydrolase